MTIIYKTNAYKNKWYRYASWHILPLTGSKTLCSRSTTSDDYSYLTDIMKDNWGMNKLFYMCHICLAKYIKIELLGKG